MEKRLNRKIGNYMHDFKDGIKEKMAELGFEKDQRYIELLQYIYDMQTVEITKIDLQKRKRVKNSVPLNERCCALRANHEQCTRRKKEGERFCGTHIKGTPHGEMKEGEIVQDSTVKVDVWAQDIKGIIYFIDKKNNVYDPQDVHQNLHNPRIIAKYSKTHDGEYSLVKCI